MVFIVKIAYAIVITDFQLDGFPKSYLFNFVNSWLALLFLCAAKLLLKSYKC